MSFPFLNLDPAIRKRIFRFVLLSDDHMLPFYNFGSLELPNHLLDADFSNIDVGLALSNKQLNIEGTDVLYGENTFDFSNADVAIWWFRRVGRNVAKVRKAYFYLDCGEINHLSVMKEKMWLNFFNWLAPRHQLKKVFISFEQWKRFKEYNSHGKTCIGYDVALKAQNETADVIKKFRNLINVTIAHGHYLNLREVRDMENQMTRKKEINVSITKDEEGELRLGEALVAQVAIRERVAGSTVA
ncbi:hypothetical protein MMC06_002089 [Schaereria dolodes]|nr:hypothetical protein [Schaereria dolodes]